MWAALINVIVGIWLMLAPAYLHFDKTPATNYYIVGPLVITFAITSLWEFNRSLRYFNLLGGFWMLVSILILQYDSSAAIWSTALSGTLLIVCSLVKGKQKGNYGGGWKTLFDNDDKFFKDKVVVITGASGGVGRVVAWEFARQEAKVVLIARDELQLQGAAKEVEVYGGTPFIIQCDIADHVSLQKSLERIEREVGPIEVLVNNAMNSVFAPFRKVTPEEFKRVTEVTYLGTVYCTSIVLNWMQQRNRGSIVFVGSALAYRGIPLQSAYCGAKHGIQGFYDSLRTELMHDKSSVKTCMVQLPAMDTTQFGWVLSKLPNKAQPMGKIYTPEVAARSILFAAKHNRREILVGFPSYKAIVGNKIAPWYADWVLARTGIKGQQTNEPADPDRKHNLWEPVGEDRGAYGGFEDQSHDFSFTLWISMNRTLVRLTALMAMTGLAAWLFLWL
ncbi:MAG TPA: SDR family oxidoreductase [Chryseosolibacter sp.]|nr:SDR family oxidoreductase [Chryseosolibacter sp.]